MLLWKKTSGREEGIPVTAMKKTVLPLALGILGVCLLLFGGSALLQPSRDAQVQAAVERLEAQGAFGGVQVRYEGTCTAADPAGQPVALRAILPDPAHYASRADLPADCPAAVRAALARDLQAQRQARGLAGGEEMSVTRIVEE